MMHGIVKWASLVIAAALVTAAVLHSEPQFGWQAAVFIAVAGGEEVVEIIRQVRP